LPETLWQHGDNTALTGRIYMLLEILNLVLGIAFGFFHQGKEDYTALLKDGVIAGLVLGIIFVLAAQYLVPGGMSIDIGFWGVMGIFVEIIIFLAIFILGTFIGDKLEGLKKK
jgi:hypothetical protein